MSILKRATSGVTAAMVMLSSLMSLSIIGTAHAVANNCTWSGATDLKFSTAANWTSCGGGIPQTGDNLVFDITSLSSNMTLNNDITGLSVGTITFQGTHNSSYNYYVISGSPLSLGAITDTTPVGNSLLTDVTLNSDLAVSSNLTFGDATHSESLNLNGHNITVAANSDLNETNLAGSGNITVNGGDLSFIGTAPSTWTGNLTLNSGGSADTYPGIINASNPITVNDNGALAFCGFDGADFGNPITVTGRGGAYTDSNTGVTSYYGALITYSSCGQGGAGGFNSMASVNLTGTVTLTGNTSSAGEGELKVSGPLHGSYTLTEEPGNAGKITIASSDNQSATANGTQNSAMQTVTYSGDHSSDYVNIGTNQIGIVDGNFGTTFVASGGILKGTGSVDSLDVAKDGIVAPGHSPGKFTARSTLSLEGGSTYQAELKDTAAGDFDQLAVGTAADTTGNDVKLGDGTAADGLPTLDVSLYTGYKIKAGDQFRIIDNLSGTAVLGTFNNLPESATFSVNGGTFKISYVGGDGNDVVLTVVTAPKTPDTGFALVSSHPAATLGMTVLAAGVIVAIARSNRKLAPAKARATSKRR